MPRGSRIDAPGGIHHIIARGISFGNIFNDDIDRDNFLNRIKEILNETETPCYAWSLMPNHLHLLLRTGKTPIATVMRRLLTGHAVFFNRRHKRSGHLFQNRYKSILCEEDVYLLELVRYIHLNPCRAGLVSGLVSLDRYPYSGHSTVMGYIDRAWQDTGYILSRFGERIDQARERYSQFIREGQNQGRRPDLIGGGLIRSQGGWASVKAKRKKGEFQKFDERILGGSDFVQQVLTAAQERLERRQRLKTAGFDLDALSRRVAKVLNTDPALAWLPGKEREKVRARSLLCYWAVRELGVAVAELSRGLKISLPAVSKSVSRGEKIAVNGQYQLAENES